MAAVLKTVDPQGSGGSNPSSSASREGSWSLCDRLFLVCGGSQACLDDVRDRKQLGWPPGPTSCLPTSKDPHPGMPQAAPAAQRNPSSSKRAVFEDEHLKSFISSSFSPLFEDEPGALSVSSSKSAYIEDEFFAERGKKASMVRAGRPVKRAT